MTRTAAEIALHLAPYARRSVDAAERLALDMHADELTVEHLFCTLLADEETAAAQAVLHAFADPETLSVEMMAMCPGIAVVGSATCVPFSVHGVAALRAAHAAADTVEPIHLVRAGLGALPDESAAALREVGARVEPLLPLLPGARHGAGPLFQTFSTAARKAASLAGREAQRHRRRAISPVHLIVGALEADEGLRATAGLTPTRVRSRLAGADDDPTPPPPRAIPPSPELRAFLGEAARGSDTLALLALLFEHGAPELGELFVRQKVTPDVVARGRDGFEDPD